MKTCRKCQQEKPFAEFYKRTGAKDGYKASCKMCGTQAEYYIKNRNNILSNKRTHRENNREQYLKKDRNYYQENKDAVLARNSLYIKRNPLTRKRASQAYRARLTSSVGHVPPNYWEILVEKFGERCINSLCTYSITNINPLSLDHIVPLSQNGLHDISNFQILCRSCNAKKGTKTIDYR